MGNPTNIYFIKETVLIENHQVEIRETPEPFLTWAINELGEAKADLEKDDNIDNLHSIFYWISERLLEYSPSFQEMNETKNICSCGVLHIEYFDNTGIWDEFEKLFHKLPNHLEKRIKETDAVIPPKYNNSHQVADKGN